MLKGKGSEEKVLKVPHKCCASVITGVTAGMHHFTPANGCQGLQQKPRAAIVTVLPLVTDHRNLREHALGDRS